MSGSFYQQLYNLVESVERKEDVSAKVLQRRAEEESLHVEIFTAWMETVHVICTQGVQAQDSFAMFLAHFSHKEHPQNPKLLIKSPIVELVKYVQAKQVIPIDLAHAYYIFCLQHTLDESGAQLQHTISKLETERRTKQEKLLELGRLFEEQSHFVQQQEKVLQSKLKELENASFLQKLSANHRVEVEKHKKDLEQFEMEHKIPLIDVEFEKNLVESDVWELKHAITKKHQELSVIQQNKNDQMRQLFDVVNLSYPIEFSGCVIPPGGYWRGGLDVADQTPLRTIQTERAYWISDVPVTQALFIVVMGYNPSGRSDVLRPVEMISWYDAVNFCNRLSVLCSLQPVYTIGADKNIIWNENANGYRLPTEAEWEIAARTKNNNRFSGGDIPDMYVWMQANSKNQTQRVRQRRPNSWDLYDMSGNVWEWCFDWYQSNYYVDSVKINPTGPKQGTSKVMRGGSAISDVKQCTVSYRYHASPHAKDAMIGFRIVRSI